ncbi:MAG: choice-of-anchor D domain-containing protein [Candidatus Cloacimonetes bacterium]|nr:choice-of-anchor D domain-containing protein [Candidatus Cloacimonadota bacterium]
MRRFSIVIILMLFASMGFAQLAVDYIFTVTAGTYTPITGGMVLGNESSNAQVFFDPTLPVGSGSGTGPGFPIGFDFNYMGKTFDRVAVCTDGWISLGQSSLTPSVWIPTTYIPISYAGNITPPHLISRISALGSDLGGQPGSSMRIETVGSAPNRELVVQWSNFRKRASTGDNYNFQIRLQENGDKVVVVYGLMQNNHLNNNAQVGIRGEPATPSTNYKNLMGNSSWINPTPGVANDSRITLNATVFPPEGTTYTWALPVIDSPPAPTTAVYPTDGEDPVSIYSTISWERAYGPDGYKLSLWYENPTTYVENEIDLGYTTSYSPSEPLESDTEYFWQVIPYNSFGDSEGCPVWTFKTAEAGLIPIGTGNASLQLPINPFYNYSYTQGIYYQNEINTSGQRIEKISYEWNGGGDGSNSNQWDIYMGHTDKNNFSASSSWVPFSDLVQVFSGTVPITSEPGWVEITLDRPFLYNNEDNLVIAVNDVSPGSNTHLEYFYCTPTPGLYRSLRDYVSGSPIVPANHESSLLTLGFPNVQLRFKPIPEYPEFAFDLFSVDFGTVPQNRWVGPIDIKITNVGSGTLFFNSSDLYFSGPNADRFQFSDVNLPAVLEQNESVLIPVYVNAQQEGYFEANLVARYGGRDFVSVLSAVGNPVGDAIVGTGAKQVPFPFFSDFLVWGARTQSLFTADELFAAGAVAGTLDRVGWYPLDWGMGTMENFTVRVKGVPYTTTSITEFHEDGFTTCYDPEDFEVYRMDWNFFDFDTPFVWNGIDNIIVEAAFTNVRNFGYQYVPVYATTAPGKTLVYADDDMGMMDPTGGPMDDRPNIFFSFTPASDTAVFNIVPDVGSWSFGMVLVDQEPTKTFRVSNSGSSDLVFNSIDVNGAYFSPAEPFDTSPIAPSTYRDFVVKYHPTAAGGPFNGNLVFTFSREVVTVNLSGSAYLPTTLPFTETWEGGSNIWVLVNEDQTNKWHHGTASPHQGNYSVFISNDGGMTNAYSETATSVSHIYRDFAFDEDSLEFPLKFWWKSVGESSQDRMRVYLADVSYVPVAGTEIPSTYQVGNAEYGLYGGWNQATINLPREASGTVKRLIFSWSNNSTIGSQPPVSLDDITINATPLPTDPMAPPILVYPANGETDLSRFGFAYQFQWNTEGMEPDVYTLFIAKVDDLEPGFDADNFFSVAEPFENITSPYIPDFAYDYNTNYLWTVSAYHIASEDEAFHWPPYEFRTETDISITSFPWIVDFENVPTVGFPLTGWQVYNMDESDQIWSAIQNYNHTPGGNFSAVHIWENVYSNDWLVTPPLVLGADDWMLNFWNMSLYPDDYTYYGVMVTAGIPDPNIGPWTQVWNPASITGNWENESIDLSAYAGETIHIAFVYQGSNGPAWFLDDITVRSLTSDNIPPIISHLPILGTPRFDADYPVVAVVVDDTFWNSPIGGVEFTYSTDGGDNWSPAIPMQLQSGSTYVGYIPAQPLGTVVWYQIKAWDIFFNITDTEEYFFNVADPTWIYYDYGQDYSAYMPSGIAPNTWGVFNYFANPMYGTGAPLHLYGTEAATLYPQTNAHLNVYLWNGMEMQNPLTRTYFDTPLSVNFSGAVSVGWNYYEFANFNAGEPLTITDPYFAIAFENLQDTGNQSTNSYFVFDDSYDYGMYGLTISGAPGNWFTFNDLGGSWSISALVGAGPVTELVAPQISIALLDNDITIQWNAILGATYYHIYASDDPSAPLPWTPIATNVTNLEYTYTGIEDYSFFYVVASSDLDARNVINTQFVSPKPQRTSTVPVNQNRLLKGNSLANPLLPATLKRQAQSK